VYDVEEIVLRTSTESNKSSLLLKVDIMILQKSFYFVRHGQTEYNLKRLCAGGKIDAPLNKTGELQAQALQEKLAHITFGKVVCSPMLRARQTAQFATTKELLFEVDLREWELGDLEGVSFEQFDIFVANLSSSVPIPNGESKELFFQRSLKAINKALHEHGEDILIVAHGGIYAALIEALGLPGDDIGNAQLIRFHYDNDSWHVIKL
jgi:broad specificity phosphatase PhoE